MIYDMINRCLFPVIAHHSTADSQKVVSAYFLSKQIMPFDFAVHQSYKQGI